MSDEPKKPRGRPKGYVMENRNGGRKPSVDYAARHAADPTGEANILLRGVPTAVLARIHERATADGISVQEWIRRSIAR